MKMPIRYIESALDEIRNCPAGHQHNTTQIIAKGFGRLLVDADDDEIAAVSAALIDGLIDADIDPDTATTVVTEGMAKGREIGPYADESEWYRFLKAADPEPVLEPAQDDDDDEPGRGCLAGILSPDKDPTVLPPPPLYVLSKPLQRIVREVAIGKSVPEEMILGILLALGSACIGRSRGLVYNASSNWTEFANLYFLLIAETGSGKSHAYSYIFKHVNDAEAKQKAAWRILQDKYEEEMLAYRKKKDANAPVPKRPKNVQYLLDDATIEAMIERLADNPRGLFWGVDEFNGFFSGLDKYNKNGGGQGKAKLLSAWDAKTISNTRKSKDGISNETYITRGTVGMFGGIQPHLMRNVFSYDDLMQGWPQRFVYIRAKSTKPMLLPLPDISPEIDFLLRKITDALLGLAMPIMENGVAETEYVTLSEEATLFFEHFQNLMSKQTHNTEAEGYAAKANRIVLRLALILHFMEWAVTDENSYSQEIRPETMSAATQLMNWLLYHTEKVRDLLPASTAPAPKTKGKGKKVAGAPDPREALRTYIAQEISALEEDPTIKGYTFEQVAEMFDVDANEDLKMVLNDLDFYAKQVRVPTPEDPKARMYLYKLFVSNDVRRELKKSAGI